MCNVSEVNNAASHICASHPAQCKHVNQLLALCYNTWSLTEVQMLDADGKLPDGGMSAREYVVRER